eukprot:CAMPEP_0114415838 /NCGR_PEP_ID=MMETSP0103-20121206/2117_1 /TAXON_ID=37642 ORGANISM="Paraphysomonas imperforata, Strain PA2" /NCGR_SAMPLE_ID=MMETSP0103 /ASSEMBLY_ACC=CAM_ASM_000201 /LENGTH=244 /DNA_ID=CAMNT_0001584037 /DNA_START=53 /DNA_END=787 /DNA_ORIENTATION=-
MNFTSSVSDLESLLNKFKESQEFGNALKVSNILDIVYSGEQDSSNILTPQREAFYCLHLALYILQDDLEGARCLWKRVQVSFKGDGSSELGGLWSVVNMLHMGDGAGALAQVIESGKSTWTSLGGDIIDVMISRIRERQWISILSSFDAITLPYAAAFLHLSAADCKEEFLARGCTYDSEQELFHVCNASVNNCAVDDGALLRTLTQTVAQLERQPLSININKEIESVQAQIVAEQEETSAMEI